MAIAHVAVTEIFRRPDFPPCQVAAEPKAPDGCEHGQQQIALRFRSSKVGRPGDKHKAKSPGDVHNTDVSQRKADQLDTQH